jgi:hypothetical protein
VLAPPRLTQTAEAEAGALLREGESANTRASCASAMRYWCAWFAARYGQALELPVPVPVVVQFIVDHAARKADADAEAGADGDANVNVDLNANLNVLADADMATDLGAPAGQKAPKAPKTKSAASPKAVLVHELPPEIDQTLVAMAISRGWGCPRSARWCTASPGSRKRTSWPRKAIPAAVMGYFRAESSLNSKASRILDDE